MKMTTIQTRARIDVASCAMNFVCCVDSWESRKKISQTHWHDVPSWDNRRRGMMGAMSHRNKLTDRSSKENTIRVCLQPSVAQKGSDTLPKEMYAHIFDALVQRINGRTMAMGRSGVRDKNNDRYGIIGSLDIFGFERFDVNRLRTVLYQLHERNLLATVRLE